MSTRIEVQSAVMVITLMTRVERYKRHISPVCFADSLRLYAPMVSGNLVYRPQLAGGRKQPAYSRQYFLNGPRLGDIGISLTGKLL